MNLDKDIKEILFSNEQIKKRCAELGNEITQFYKNRKPIFVGILKGSLPFMEELLVHLDLFCRVDYMICSSYQGTESTGLVNVVHDVACDVRGRDIVLVEDIVDSGLTIKVVKSMLLERGAESVKIVTLLDKPEGRKYDVDVDWRAFFVENQFVVGFGLDYNEFYRNLPYIGILKEEIYKK